MRCYLHNGQEGVKAIQMSASGLHWHANDWQGREGCHHPWQVRCSPCSSYDHLRRAQFLVLHCQPRAHTDRILKRALGDPLSCPTLSARDPFQSVLQVSSNITSNKGV